MWLKFRGYQRPQEMLPAWGPIVSKNVFGLVCEMPQMLISCCPVCSTATVSLLLHEEPENPKCFAEGRKDLTCFWEEDEKRADSADQYSFIYSYQYGAVPSILI